MIFFILFVVIAVFIALMGGGAHLLHRAFVVFCGLIALCFISVGVIFVETMFGFHHIDTGDVALGDAIAVGIIALRLVLNGAANRYASRLWTPET